MAAGSDEEKKKKKKSFCFLADEFELIFCHPCFNVICVRGSLGDKFSVGYLRQA